MKRILLAAAILFFPETNFAQTTFATITGLITDPNGAVIPGASVVVTNTDTNYRYSARSNDTGYYSIAQLLEGVYDLSAEAPGFARFERGIRIANQEVRRIDIRFDLASVQTAVEVNGGASLIETEKARISDTKGADVIKSLP